MRNSTSRRPVRRIALLVTAAAVTAATMLTTLSATTAGAAGGNPSTIVAASAPPSSRRTCAIAISLRPIYTPFSATIHCVAKSSKKLAGALGQLYKTSKYGVDVYISRSAAHPLDVMAHEMSHAFSIQIMDYELRQRFAKAVGQPTFWSGKYSRRPSEIWADNQARCHGYGNNKKIRNVKCSTIRKYEKLARARHAANPDPFDPEWDDTRGQAASANTTAGATP